MRVTKINTETTATPTPTPIPSWESDSTASDAFLKHFDPDIKQVSECCCGFFPSTLPLLEGRCFNAGFRMSVILKILAFLNPLFLFLI
jgi:hypothetical protein